MASFEQALKLSRSIRCARQEIDMFKFSESLKVWALWLALGLHMHGKRLQSPRETD